LYAEIIQSLFFVYCGSNFDIEIKTNAQCWRKSNDCAVVFLTTVIPLYFHFKNWLTFVQQQN